MCESQPGGPPGVWGPSNGVARAFPAPNRTQPSTGSSNGAKSLETKVRSVGSTTLSPLLLASMVVAPSDPRSLSTVATTAIVFADGLVKLKRTRTVGLLGSKKYCTCVWRPDSV